MRQIKFRAWDKKYKVMSYLDRPWNITRDLITSLSYEGGTEFEQGHLIYNIELQQYTGLKDKNGKDVFEGDLIMIEGNIKAEVYWEYSAWQLRDGDKTGGMLGNWEPEQIEVIGNIWEK